MADGAVIGALRFVIGADTADFESGVKKAQSALTGFVGGQIGSALTRVGGMIAGAFAIDALINFASRAVDTGAAIGQLAQTAGLGVIQFQELQFALRGSGVQGEQMSQAFAMLSRNLSDLNRGTGPLLDFIRRFAPSLEQQLRGVTDVSQAFEILTRFTAGLTSEQDRLRVAQAAGGEQMGRLMQEAVRLGGSLNDLRQQAHDAGRVLTEEQIAALRDAKQAYSDFGDQLLVLTGRFVAWIVEQNRLIASLNTGATTAREGLQTLGGTATVTQTPLRSLQLTIENLTHDLNLLNQQAGNFTQAIGKIGTGTSALSTDQIKAAEGELQLLMARLQMLPPQMTFVATNFAAAWNQMATVMRQANATDAAIEAARINMLRQQDQARIQALGNAMTVQEQLQRREMEIAFARQTNLITETEAQRALNQARFEFADSQIRMAQSLGVVLTPMEQFEAQLNRITAAEERGAISAQAAARAHQMAAVAMVGSYVNAAGDIANNLSQVFGKNKAIAAAAAIISGLAGAVRAIEIYGPTPWGWAAAASAVALGVANAAKIRATSENGSASAATSGGAAVSTGSTVAPQTLMVQGINPNQMFSGEFMRDFAQKLIDFQRDGGVVILK